MVQQQKRRGKISDEKKNGFMGGAMSSSTIVDELKWLAMESRVRQMVGRLLGDSGSSLGTKIITEATMEKMKRFMDNPTEGGYLKYITAAAVYASCRLEPNFDNFGLREIGRKVGCTSFTKVSARVQ